jgi:hypothetical protein
MINNFVLLNPIFNNIKDDEVISVMLLKRKKDFTTEKSNHQSVRMIRTYSFKSLDDFNYKEEEIINLCEHFKCRAYIDVRKKNNKTIALDMLKQIADQIKNEQYDCSNVYNSVLSSSSTKDKVWIVDLDSKDDELYYKIITKISEVSEHGHNGLVLYKVPTRQGYNILTTPFRMDVFMKWKEENKIDVDVHKHGTALLYYPNSLNN